MPTIRSFSKQSGPRDRALVVAVIGVLAATCAAVLNFADGAPEPAFPPPATAMPAVPPPPPDGKRAPPSFDVARVNAKGDTVIAGRAAPGAAVEITAGGQAIGATVADVFGEWVIVPESPLVPGEHRLRLRSSLHGSEPVPGFEEILIVVHRPLAAPGTQPSAAGQPLPLVVKIPASGPPVVLQAPAGGAPLPPSLQTTR